eukprot:4141925-Prymnesium_polylepis.1
MSSGTSGCGNETPSSSAKPRARARNVGYSGTLASAAHQCLRFSRGTAQRTAPTWTLIPSACSRRAARTKYMRLVRHWWHHGAK